MSKNPPEIVQSRDALEQRLYALFCAFYFTANFVLRWAATQFFGGTGAFGWPDPSQLQIAGMVLAIFASSLAVFYFLPGLCTLVAASLCGRCSQRPVVRWTIGTALIVAILYMECDNDWYSLSKEHIRLSDIAIFLESEWERHFGLAPSDIAWVVVRLAVHAVILAGAWWVTSKVAGVLADHRLLQSRTILGVNLALLLLLATGAYASFHLTSRNDSQWSTIVSRNLYDVTPSRFIKYRHPDAGALNELLTRSALELPNPAGESPVSDNPAKAAPGIRHILLIAIEGWNPSFVGPDTMPFFSELQKEGIRFTNHYTSGNNTLLGILGIVYGQSPAFFFQMQADDGTRSPFMHLLKANGYALKRFGAGLDSYRNIETYIRELELGSRAEDFRQIPPSIREHIRSNRRTFSLFFHEYTTHWPYRHSEQFSKFQPEFLKPLTTGVKPHEIPKLHNRYRNTLAEADADLRTLFKAIDWRSMLIVITGDHGEAMMENGRLAHSSSLEKPQVATPLFLYYPGIVSGVFTQTSSHLDVMPTIFDILDFGQVENAHGLSLLRKYRSRSALVAHNNQNNRPTRIAVINGNSKLVLDLSSLRDIQVIDLMSSDDSLVRLGNVSQEEVIDGMKYVSGVMRLSGCSVTGQSPAQTAPGGQGSRTPLRHCR